MEKKDIYEHLAKIYLDTPLRRKEIIKKNYISKKIIVISIIVVSVVVFSVLVLVAFNKPIPRNAEFSHLLQSEVIKINFNFDPAKQAIYSIDLNKLNLANFKAVEFSVKKSEYKDNLSLRVEVNNTFQEKSEVYVRDVSSRWKHYKIGLSEFKKISDWSEMSNLSFIIEEWNTIDKRGVMFIDNVKFSK